MGTKTIGIGEDAYERLKARKRDDESFTDVVNRLIDEADTDWREGFGTLDGDADELVEAAETSRSAASADLADRQKEAIEEFESVSEDVDETA